MMVGPAQCFLVILLITGLVGMARGWVREIITMAIVLGTVLFLLNGGNGLLHQFIFVNIPQALHDLIFGTSQVTIGAPTISTPNPTGDYLFQLGSFVGLTGLGYIVGHRYGTPPTANQHRLAGIVPGLINGGAISYYASQTILPSTTFNLTSPNSGLTQAYLPIILGLGVIGVVVAFLASGNKGGGAKKSH
jgi:hypothetical protein